MSNHHFTLIVEGRDMRENDVIDSLFECGCDDGTVGRSDGIQFMVFDREADRLDEAVLSAVNDIERVPGLEVVRIADAGQRQAQLGLPRDYPRACGETNPKTMTFSFAIDTPRVKITKLLQ